jgi:formylglycine-generating enzyme required for sulfatase activity
MTTAVDYYTAGISPYGIYDLAGNVWEWCLDLSEESVDAPEGHVIRKRAVIGGSHVSPYERSQINFNYYLDPVTVYASIGFRAIESVD